MAGQGLFYELVYEFVARRVMNTWDALRGARATGHQEPLSPAAVAAEKNISSMEIKEAVALLWSAPGLNSTARDNFISAHQALSKKRKDKLEEGLGALLKQFKNGIWPPDLERIVEKDRPAQKQKGSQTTDHTRTFEKKVYQRGWNPANLYVKTLNTAGQDVKTVKIFIDWLLQESVWENMAEEFKEKKGEVIEKTKSFILWVSGIYLFLVFLSGILAYSMLKIFLKDPTNTSMLIWGSLWMLAFSGLVWIVAKPLLPKES